VPASRGRVRQGRLFSHPHAAVAHREERRDRSPLRLIVAPRGSAHQSKNERTSTMWKPILSMSRSNRWMSSLV
jgi:hypothetical protein